MNEKELEQYLHKKAEEHLRWAQEIKELFPNILTNFTAEEIRQIWEEYSADYWAAGWMGVDDRDEERVRKVFTVLYPKDGLPRSST